MTKVLTIFLSFLFISGCVSSSDKSDNNNDKTDSYTLVWQDDFDYIGLPDSTKWDYDTEGNSAGWGNNEAQYYTEANKKNAWVEDGILNITAINEELEGKEFTSARLMSKADWEYGRIEVRAKLPEARGTWSAIWAMPAGWTFNDGDWPNIGELDIMEHVGHDLGIVHASAHSKDYQWQKQTQKTNTIYVDSINTKFNSYILDWTPDMLSAYIDDSLYFQYQNEGLGESKWPYNKPFYLILNVAVGGAWGNMQGVDKEVFPQTMEVDYVRVYQKNNASDKF